MLYNYTEKDAFWTQASADGSAQTYRVTMGETRYVDAMLDYIQDILRGVKRNAINRVVRKNGNGFDK